MATHELLTMFKHNSQISMAEILDAIMSAAVDGIFLIGVNGVITYVNPGGCKLTGFTTEEMVGNNISMIIPEPFKNNHDRFIKYYLRTGKSKVMGAGRELKSHRKDGSLFPVHLAVTQCTVGGKIYFLGILRDLSTKVDRENLLKREMELIQSEKLLLAILPPHAAARIKRNETVVDSYEAVTVMFADLVGFTNFCSSHEPLHVVEILNSIFSFVDAILLEFPTIMKIKTIGDCVMTCTGLSSNPTNAVVTTNLLSLSPSMDESLHDSSPHSLQFSNSISPTSSIDTKLSPDKSSRVKRLSLSTANRSQDNTLMTVEFANELLDHLEKFNHLTKSSFQFRIGMNTGSLVAAVIGRTMLTYDVWGDAVNIASRMEGKSDPGKILCPHETTSVHLLGKFMLEDRGDIDIKGKGILRCDFVGKRIEDFFPSD
eukprot:Sdes_comp20845_c1_seq1m17555